jgi:hypothetical protein
MPGECIGIGEHSAVTVNTASLVSPLSPCTTGTSRHPFHDFRNFASVVRGCNLALKCALRFIWCNRAPEGRKVLATVSEGKETMTELSKSRKGYTDVQGAPRFPIKLPVAFKSVTGGKTVETDNISANGVLFHMDADVPVGSSVDFTISLPADVVGAEADVQVDCRGRVVRSFQDGGRRGVGVVIDEYRFERK